MNPTYRHDREATLQARIDELEAEVDRLQRPGLWTRFGLWAWSGDTPNSRPAHGIFEVLVGVFYPPHGMTQFWADVQTVRDIIGDDEDLWARDVIAEAQAQGMSYGNARAAIFKLIAQGRISSKVERS